MEAVLTLYSVCIEESPLFEEQCKMRLSLKGEKRKKEKKKRETQERRKARKKIETGREICNLIISEKLYCL